jgi:hypothetical protein
MKFAKNLPTPTFSPVPSKTKETFNHQNPFNLDLNALSAYQKQEHNAGGNGKTWNLSDYPTNNGNKGSRDGRG